MNRPSHEEDSKSRAIIIASLLEEDSLSKIGKETNIKVLDELRFVYSSKSVERMVRKVETRMRELGASFDPLVG